jgi:glycosyltransferase involved in cell wall biosynthesis
MFPQSPLITAIICTYRRPEMLRRAITSVQKQTYRNFVICVYDNASDDETAEVVKELVRQDSRIQYFCRPENIGLLANYSDAMKAVQTPFFSFIADDDVMLPNFYEHAIAVMEKCPDAMIFAGSFHCVSLEGNRVGGTKFESKVLQPPAAAFQFIESDNYPNLHATLIRREVINDFREFRYFWSDREFLCRIAVSYPILTDSADCLLFMMHDMDKGKERELKIEHAWQVHETVYEAVSPFLSIKEQKKLESVLYSRVRENIYLIGIELLYKGDWNEARSGAKKFRQDYGLSWQPIVLDSLAFLFEKVPFLGNFLRSTRDLRPPVEKEKSLKGSTPILPYETLMKIYK